MIWRIVIALVLVIANAFFVAAEFGLVAVRRTRVQELVDQGSRRAGSALKAIAELNLMLSGCQLGITFSSLGLGAIGEPVLAGLFQDLFDFVASPFNLVVAHTAAIVGAFVVITFLHVVVGELVPKNLAIAVPETTALWVATPIRVFAFMFRPLIWLFNETANVTLRIFGVEPKLEIGGIHTPDELAIIIEESSRGGAIDAGHSKILARTLEFPEKRAIEAMVPRVSAQSIAEQANLEDLLSLAEQTGYSRFPVFNERQDEFVGVVHLKEMLREGRLDPQATVKDAMRTALLVPESSHLEDVLIRMRKERNHFAIILDEFGSTSGIITMEDILEELVGEIRDEYDVKEIEVREVKGGKRVPGTIRPDELADATGCELPEGEFETVGGFILDQLGRLAHRGDEIEVKGFKLRVANVRRRRIVSVDVSPLIPPISDPTSDSSPSSPQ